MNPSSDSLQFWLKETRLYVVVRALSPIRHKGLPGETVSLLKYAHHMEKANGMLDGVFLYSMSSAGSVLENRKYNC